MRLEELGGLVREKVFDPFDQQPVAIRCVHRGVVTCAGRVEFFLSRECFDEGAIVQPVIVKLEEFSDRCRHYHNAAKDRRK